MRKQVKRLAVEGLRPSETHAKAYSKRKVDMLAQSMFQHGQLEPIIVNQDGVILSGVLRWEAAK
jgi:ParB-like chromosome segregation protein Spo0J